jgi:hypothetical protein
MNKRVGSIYNRDASRSIDKSPLQEYDMNSQRTVSKQLGNKRSRNQTSNQSESIDCFHKSNDYYIENSFKSDEKYDEEQLTSACHK